VSRGGFSGGQFNIRTGPGSNFIRRSTSLNFDAPSLQWTDPAARSLGQQYTNVSLGGSLSGPVTFDKAFYNVAYQLGRRSSELRSLLNTDPTGLQATGLSADSVQRLIVLLSQAGVPTTVGGRIPQNRLTDNGSVFGSVDFTPPTSTTNPVISHAVSSPPSRMAISYIRPSGELMVSPAGSSPAVGMDRHTPTSPVSNSA